MTMRQLEIVEAILALGDSAIAQNIAESIGVHASTVSRHVKVLLQQGIIDFEVDFTDGQNRWRKRYYVTNPR